MAATDYSSLLNLCNCDTVDIPAIQSLLFSSSPSALTQFLSYQHPSEWRNPDGWTPLHAACFNGHHQVVQLLLAAGTNKETPDMHGRKPLDTASSRGHLQIVEMLLAAGTNQDTPNKDGWTPLNVASS